MKKFTLLFLCLLLVLPITYAAYFKDVPQTKVQPNGDTLHCFATGDEYFHRLHDANNYTIVLDPATGYYVYADKVGNELIPTSYIAGHDNPAEVGLIPGLSISAEQWRERRQRWAVPTPPHYGNHTRLSDGRANHGQINNIVIFIRFADDDEFSTSFDNVNSMFNDSTLGASSMYNYFKSVSYNQLYIKSYFYPTQSGSQIVSYQDIFNRNYFEPFSSNNPQGYSTDDERTYREHALLARAVDAVASQIPSNLNIDYNNDGYVDNVVFVVCGNVGGWNDLLWPHRWSLYTENASINGKIVWDYNLQLADASSNFNTSILCHEMNHSLGAPDLYHYYEGTDLESVRNWDLMGTNTTPPQHMGAYMKYKYGYWIDSIPEITECGTYSLHSVGSSATNNCYKISSPNANEFFVLEYRNTNNLFESALPTSGLLVYRINTDFEGNAAWDGVNLFDEVYIYRPNGTISQNGNINNAAFGSNFGRTEMNANTNPQPFLTDGTVVDVNNFTIRDISAAGEDSITFTVCRAPFNVTTTPVTNITHSTATCGGNVTDDNGNTITMRGVCWSTLHNPTIFDNHTIDGSGTGSFTSNLTGLASNTVYYIRAYATTNVGTAYGEEISFRTLIDPNGDNLSCRGTPIVTDRDGNVYNTVQIGEQCWMRENLRTTQYADGTTIAHGLASVSLDEAYYYYPYNNSDNVSMYGLFYNWKASMGDTSSISVNSPHIQGICPNGWHLPSDAEWTQLTNYVSSQSQYWCDGDSTYIAKALAATDEWADDTGECTVGNMPNNNNATGFGALPAGYCDIMSVYWYFKIASYFWSSTEYSTTTAFIRSTVYFYPTVIRTQLSKGSGCSIRCLRNETETEQQLPTVSTIFLNEFTNTSVSCSATVTSDGESTVTARGICWGTEPSPTINNSHTTEGYGIGSFSSMLTGLTPGITYYARAYATNSVGTAYGMEVSFATAEISEDDGQPCREAATVTDYDGNVYNTVKIGNQCWTKENLRTLHYADGTPVSNFASIYGNASYSYPDNDTSIVSTYGLLYNWSAIMGNYFSSDYIPSGVQGICPEGWHVPSDNEWYQLTVYVKSKPQYRCDYSSNTSIAKALSATTGWRNSDMFCTVGNNPSENNATGFSALPSGRDGYKGTFWCSTLYNNNADAWSIRCTESFVDGSVVYSLGTQFAVRCVHGAGVVLPTVTTAEADNITYTSATCGGNASAPDGEAITARGVCWSIFHKPTTNDNHTIDGSGTGNFTSNLTGLISNHTYYVRAYVTNQYGTVYGEEVSFTTPVNPNGDEFSCPGLPFIADHDGNIYNTVQIGGQCWMRENLRTTHYADGTAIAQGHEFSSTTGYWYYPDNDTANKQTHGLLYNWPAIMDTSSSSNATPSSVQGLCPTGWHVPSDIEWTILTDYVSSQSEYLCNYNSNYIAKALATTMGWYDISSTCCVGYSQGNNNSTGFSALPAGDNWNHELGYTSYFWTATEKNSYSAYNRYISFSEKEVYRNFNDKSRGYSIRCIWNEGLSQYFPTVIVDSITDLTSSSATVNGAITASNGVNITTQGICWSNTQNPTIADAHTTDSSISSNFSYSLTGLLSNLTYYVRAYATNQYGIIYSNEVSFTTPISSEGDNFSCPGTPTLTDQDGNIYNTLQIGGQCWMRENLRTTLYADGTSIAQSNGTSYMTDYLYDPNDDTSSRQIYGLLYSWPAIMHGDIPTNATPSGVQGICPNGWHIPSDAEWTQLTDYVSSQSEYVCNGESTYIAKALAASIDWDDSYSAYCTPGYIPSENNSTGFSALPIGYCYNSVNYNNFGNYACFWSATEQSGSYAYKRCIYIYNSDVIRDKGYKEEAYSVRCLRDEGQSQYFPTVTTDSVTDIAATSATCNSSISAANEVEVTARGVCWSISHNPTTADSHTIDSNGSGSFTSNLTGLTSNFTYYVRAYATNQYGTVYGEEVSFTTPVNPNGDEHSCPGTPILTDHNGNTYNTVQIGGQCWMRENLRTTQYADGTPIEQGEYASSTTAFWYYPNNDIAFKQTYGLLYNRPAVMHEDASTNATPSDVQGICPNGWHIPSDAEWAQLIDYVSGQNEYWCNGDRTSIAKALAATTGWNENNYDYCTPGNLPSDNNATHFGALPAGYYLYSEYNTGSDAYFWSATEQTVSASCFNLLYYSSDFIHLYRNKYFGFSVRCLRNEGQSQYFPTVITDSITDIATNTANCHSTLSAEDGVEVTRRGVCWSINHYPTTADNHTNDDSSTGNYTSNLTGLSSNFTYFVRAYATNQYGTVYGEEISFTTSANPNGDELSCLSAHTLTDHDGNVYNTVQIGEQCWMRENLRTTQYADGTTIEHSNYNSYTTGHWNYPSIDTVYKQSFGLLYNWPAVMYGATSTNATPSGVQGICPNGWHVPSNAEWTQLINYVSNQNEYLCDGSSEYIAKALTANTGWNNSYSYCTPGDLPSDNNATGFGILPSGYHTDGSTNPTFGYGAYFWSATEESEFYAYHQYIWYSSSIVNRNTDSKYMGQSVRCLRDEGMSQYFPTVITDSITLISSTTAICGGNITDDGGSTIITRGVYWSTSPTLNITDNHTNDDSGAGSFSSNITNLSPSTTYYVRAYATNHSGTSYGELKSFTTPCDTMNISINGENTIDYGQSTTLTASGAYNYLWSTNINEATTPSVTVSPTQTTTYTVTGTNQNGCSATASITVTVNPVVPMITTSNITNITNTTATCGGNVTDDGGASVTAYGICWNTSQNPTISDNHTDDGSGTGNFSSNITGLSPNTTYYVRAYATNSVGINYGEEVSFTTQCNQTSDTINANICYGNSYAFGNMTLTEAGTFSHVSIMTDGCDSITVLHLTVQYGTYNATSISECESYTWTAGTGETYTQSGTYIHYYNNTGECPNVDTLHLIIENPDSSEFFISDTACYVWNNIEYCESGDYTQILQTVHDCDSIVTLHLTITPVGINDHSAFFNFHINVYPNPAHHTVTVKIDDSGISISYAELYDAMGRKIKALSWPDNNNTQQIDINEFATGLYFIKLYNKDNYLGTAKIIKQ